jgi:phosphoribosylanthranilate isomerase
MGFIFWEKSSRYFDGMIPELPKSIKTGVFVDESIAIIIEKVTKIILKVQLHGTRICRFCLNLKSEWKANI